MEIMRTSLWRFRGGFFLIASVLLYVTSAADALGSDTIQSAGDILQFVLPGILGWQDGKRYLVLAQDPAELRPTGTRPRFTTRLEAHGFKLPPSIFGAVAPGENSRW